MSVDQSTRTLSRKVAPYVLGMATVPAIFTGRPTAGVVPEIGVQNPPVARPTPSAWSEIGTNLDAWVLKQRLQLQSEADRLSPDLDEAIQLRGRNPRMHKGRVVSRHRSLNMPEEQSDLEHLQ